METLKVLRNLWTVPNLMSRVTLYTDDIGEGNELDSAVLEIASNFQIDVNVFVSQLRITRR